MQPPPTPAEVELESPRDREDNEADTPLSGSPKNKEEVNEITSLQEVEGRDAMRFLNQTKRNWQFRNQDNHNFVQTLNIKSTEFSNL